MKLRLGIISIFLILSTCNLAFKDWFFRNNFAEDVYQITYFILGLISLSILIKYILDKHEYSLYILSSILTLLLIFFHIWGMGTKVSFENKFFIFLILEFFCFFCLLLVYLYILKTSKTMMNITNIFICCLFIYFQINRIDGHRYSNKEKIISENENQKIIFVEVYNSKSNQTTKDTITVKDRWIFRKILNK